VIGARDSASLQATAAAAGKTLDVSFTLPVLPSGLTSDGMYVLQSALKYGVKISTVNVMTMDYGDSVAPNPSGQMGTYAIDAAQSTFTQLGTLYGTTLSTSQRWGMVGITPMIGVNDQSDEVFGFSDAKQLVAFAEQVGLGEIAMWSLGRDQEDAHGALSYAEDNSSSLVQTSRRRSSFRISSMCLPDMLEGDADLSSSAAVAPCPY
jgi:hypothetical protein